MKRYAAAPIRPSPGDDPNLYGLNLTLPLPDGDAGRFATCEIMRAIVHDSDRHGYVAGLAAHLNEEAARACTSRRGQIAARARAAKLDAPLCLLAKLDTVYQLLRDAQDNTGDPWGTEMPRHVDQLVHELDTTHRLACDCDDIAMLGAALLRAMGFPTAFVMASKRADRQLQHVFFAASVRGAWVPLDPQETPAPFVWPVTTRVELVPVDR